MRNHLAIGKSCFFICVVLFAQVVIPESGNEAKDYTATEELHCSEKWSLGAINDSLQAFYYPVPKLDSFANLYVLDSGNNRIMKYDSLGNAIWTIGKVGHEAGNLIGAWKLDINRDKIYVLEGWNRRIQIFGLNGQYVNHFGVAGEVNDFAVDGEGYIYLAGNTSKKLISVFDEDGKKIEEFGEKNKFTTESREKLYNQISIDVTEDGTTYLAFAFAYNANSFLRKYDATRNLICETQLDKNAFCSESNRDNLRHLYVQQLIIQPEKGVSILSGNRNVIYSFNSNLELKSKINLPEELSTIGQYLLSLDADNQGNLFIGSSADMTVRKFTLVKAK